MILHTIHACAVKHNHTVLVYSVVLKTRAFYECALPKFECLGPLVSYL